MTTETAAKKDTQKLQRAIIDGLEDVKAQDIQVFNTEHLSPLFERVIVASGTSNRQTKALAASVRDAVRDAGFAKPRIEGEENGEWIIVDCGQAVAHIMQPAFRQYYHLEELWGEKPVRLKLGAPKPVVAQSESEKAAASKTSGKAGKTAAKTSAKTAAKSAAKSAPAKSAAAGKAPAKKASAGKTGAPRAAAPAPAAKARPAGAPAKRPGAAAKKTVTKVTVGAPGGSARKAPAKKAASPARKPQRSA